MNSGAAAQETCVTCTVGSLIADIRGQLLAVDVESADQEALWLLEYALGLSRLSLVVDRHRKVSAIDERNVRSIVARRIAREPLQYIFGTEEFCGLEFDVNASVLIPRPETELLVRETMRRLTRDPHPTLVDVGTGSGCLAVALGRLISEGTIFAIDSSASALETARRNADRHAVGSMITWLEGDLLAPLAGRGLEKSVSAIVSNPPYIREADWSTLQPEVRLYEPRAALIAGFCGTELHERLLVEATRYLKPGGLLIMEMGQGQSVALREKLSSMAAYKSVEIVSDEAGIDRVLIVEQGT